MNTILTDDERAELLREAISWQELTEMTEAAVLAKLREQDGRAAAIEDCLKVLRPLVSGKWPHEQALDELGLYCYAAPLPAVVQVPQFDMEEEAKAIGLPPSIYAHPGVKQLVRAAIAAAPEAPAQPSVPAPWREAVKVMECVPPKDMTSINWRLAYKQGWGDAIRAAIAQVDSLEGGK